MSDPVTPNIPPAWYPDPAGGPQQRWWDGTQWTDHYQQPYTMAVTEYPKAPEGIPVYGPWIWLIVVMPLIPSIALLFIPWGSMFDIDVNDPSSVYGSPLALFFSPGYLIAIFSSGLVYLASALFAYLDWKKLAELGVARPFHFAWVFLSSVVYVIGRSVVVGRRTGGRGKAPIYAEIAMLVLSFAISIIIMIMLFGAMNDFISRVGVTG